MTPVILTVRGCLGGGDPVAILDGRIIAGREPGLRVERSPCVGGIAPHGFPPMQGVPPMYDQIENNGQE